MTIVAEDDAIRIERLQLGPFGTNAYVVVCRKTGDSLLVDAPGEPHAIMERLEHTTPRYILLTHSHFDHIGALPELRSRLRVPLAAHRADAAELDAVPELLLADAETISLGALDLAVLHTPGHTPGSLCLTVGRYLISGDTIFPGGPGKTGSPAAFRQIIRSLTEKIFVLPDDTPVLPGHGDSTVLKKEKGEFAVFNSRPHAPDLCGDVLWLSA